TLRRGTVREVRPVVRGMPDISARPDDIDIGGVDPAEGRKGRAPTGSRGHRVPVGAVIAENGAVVTHSEAGDRCPGVHLDTPQGNAGDRACLAIPARAIEVQD